MDKLITVVKKTPKTRVVNDDDLCDRLSSRYTVVMLVVFAAFVLLKEYFSKPITCWAPVHFKHSHRDFATNYCWIKNTYYIPWEQSVPSEWGKEEDRQMITYYQWIPFILIGQAILFYLPSLVWHGLNSRAGVDADSILSSAHTLSKTETVEIMHRNLKMLTSQMDRFLSRKNKSHGFHCDCKTLVSATCCRICGKSFGNYLLILFLFSKLCYIGNVIGQLFILNVVLSTKYHTFGFDIVYKMTQDKSWAEDSYVVFPRVTLCDFEIRGQDMNNVHRYTLQCVLPVNLYNEKIYIFLWYWMVFIATVSCINLLLWLLRAIIRKDRTTFIKNHLSLGKMEVSSKELSHFRDKYLRQDGCLLLRLIAHNTDHITTTDIMCALFENSKDHIQNLENEEHTKLQRNDENNGDIKKESDMLA